MAEPVSISAGLYTFLGAIGTAIIGGGVILITSIRKGYADAATQADKKASDDLAAANALKLALSQSRIDESTGMRAERDALLKEYADARILAATTIKEQNEALGNVRNDLAKLIVVLGEHDTLRDKEAVTLTAQITAQTLEIAALKTQIEKLANEMKGQGEMIVTQTGQIEAQAKEITALKEEIKGLREELKVARQETKDAEAQTDKVEDKTETKKEKGSK